MHYKHNTCTYLYQLLLLEKHITLSVNNLIMYLNQHESAYVHHTEITEGIMSVLGWRKYSIKIKRKCDYLEF